MFNQIPADLWVSWAVFSAVVYVQQMHENSFRGNSLVFYKALALSSAASSFVGIGLSIYLFFMVEPWYASILFLVLASLAGTTVSFFVEKAIGSLTVSLAGFILWPTTAVWSYFLISKI